MTKKELLDLPAEQQYAKVKQMVVDLLKQHNNIDEDVDANSSLREDLGLDSLSVIELVIYLERPLGICIPDASLEDVETVDDLVNVTIKYLNEQ